MRCCPVQICECAIGPPGAKQRADSRLEVSDIKLGVKAHPTFDLEAAYLKKMAIILPTGQWYAPSAVINDAWYCLVLHGIALYCIVMHGIAWYCRV